MTDIEIPKELWPGWPLPQIYGLSDGRAVKMLIYLLEMALVDELTRANPLASNVSELIAQVGEKLRVHDDDVRVALSRLCAAGVFEDVGSGSTMVRLALLPRVHEDQSYRVTALVHLILLYLRSGAANDRSDMYESYVLWLGYEPGDVDVALELLIRHNVVVIEGNTVRLAAQPGRPE